MTQGVSSLFLHVRTEPNPKVNPTLWAHRLKKARPFLRNPFEPNDEPDTGYGNPKIESPAAIQDQVFNLVQGQPSDKASESNEEEPTTPGESPNRDLEWGEQVPSWLNLFYDLAWTATFASLTSNNKFREPWDSISYITFFVAAWWLWASQVSYNVEFYTDDWFHLIFIFLQLMIFGALAATTKGFDVSNYILHSPGEDNLEPYDESQISPERYNSERLTKISLHVIMLVIAISRILLLIQHLRVVIYAKITSKSGLTPRRLIIVPVSLVISTGLFFGAFATTLGQKGTEPHGAKLKYILGGVALLVEMVAHIARLHMDIDKGLRLLSHGSMAGRLNEITAIILGECINAIAQTFYAVEQAPGFRKTTGASIVCCGIIVFFLAYLYFDGAAPLRSVRRRAAWLMMHLPWLLSVILLLEGVKNQLLLSNFFGTVGYLMGRFEKAQLEPDDDKFDSMLRLLLLQSGLTYKEENDKLQAAMQKLESLNLTDVDYNYEYEVLRHTWIVRVQLSGMFNTYKTFMDNETIPKKTYGRIQQYLTNDSFVREDIEYPTEDWPHLYQILEELLDPSLVNARYIMGLCGITFICLATLNLIQAWPRDRFHWASIFSRYAMGVSMLFLIFLNLGKYQNYMLTEGQDRSQQVAVYRWADESWVLPTIAIAYALQFVIDTFIMYAAVWYGKKQIAKDSAQTQSENKI